MLPQLKLDAPSVTDHLSGFIHSEITKAGFSRAVIGLSGGVDSALAATLTARALGSENVLCVMMPYATSNPDSLAHAVLLAEQIGVRIETVEITPMVDPVIATDPEMSDLRKGNIMARSRMIVLYDRSAREEGLVVGTGNKTETLLGYSTLFGDTACAINPLGNLYKSQVWQLARHLEIPDVIVSKAPSADLWEGQTDEGELGFSYEQADALLYFMLDEGLDDASLIQQGFAPPLIGSIRDLVRRNKYKRLPPVVPESG